MSKKKKGKHVVEYRYYEMPTNSYILALLGSKWIQTYGEGPDYLHFHNHLEIGYCYSGEGDLILEAQIHRFDNKMFSIIPKNIQHTTNSEVGTVSRWEYMFIDTEAFLNDKFKDKPLLVDNLINRINFMASFCNYEKNKKVGSLILGLLNEIRTKKQFYKENIEGMLLSLLVEIARMNEPSNREAIAPAQRGNLIVPALDYISLYFADSIRVEVLAEECCISETHFRRIFGELMKMTPIEYLNFVRIHKACDYMRKANTSLLEIAHKTGFTTVSTFNRNFKKILGSSPSEWKNHPDNYTRKLLECHIKVKEGW